jgi:hypothetical protein
MTHMAIAILRSAAYLQFSWSPARDVGVLEGAPQDYMYIAPIRIVG